MTLKPTIKQHQAYQILENSGTKYPVFGGGAGGGKIWLGCEWLLVQCYRYPGSKWFIGREELKRLMTSTYITFSKVCRHHNIPREDWNLDGKYNIINFKNGSKIDLLDVKYLPSDPLFERFGSLEYTGGWLEEAGEIHFMAFDVLKTRINRCLNSELGIPQKILITCNPKKNWLYSTVYRPWKESKLPKEYAFIQSLFGDNPHTAKSYEGDLKQIKDKATKQRLMFGNWEYDDDPATLINFEAIIDLFTNTAERSDDKYITSDIARFGQDKTVIYIWKGLEVIKIYSYEKQGTDITALKIKELANSEKILFSRIIIDEDGVGGGVVDALGGVKGFIANSTPFQVKTTVQKNGVSVEEIRTENYQNLKTQCYYKLADLINNHKISVKTEDSKIKELLIEELEQVKSKDNDKDAKRKIISKDEVKEIIGRSPDYSDCLMMRMWFEYSPQAIRQNNVYSGNINL